MNKQQQIESCEEIQQYLHQHNIHKLLVELMEQVIIHKPANIIDFLIAKLQAPEKAVMFVVGPPGLAIYESVRQMLEGNDKRYEIFNCGEEVAKISQTLSEESREKFKNHRLIDDGELRNKLLDKISASLKSDNNFIIQGFPKNLKQAISLQEGGIVPKHLLFVNVDDQALNNLCEKKLESHSGTADQRHMLLQQMKAQHRMYILYNHRNLNELKQFYSSFMEIDVSKNYSKDHVAHELKKAFQLKTTSIAPRPHSQIVVVGSPLSGRTTLGKKIASYYNFIYISTSSLIAEQIRRDTVHGSKIKEAFIKKQMIDTFLIEKLIQERTSRKDCRMQGFVLEGYPKDKQQFDNMRSIKLQPTMIVALDVPKEVCEKRQKPTSQDFDVRFRKWESFRQQLRNSNETVFWTNPAMQIQNVYQQVKFQLEKYPNTPQ